MYFHMTISRLLVRATNLSGARKFFDGPTHLDVGSRLSPVAFFLFSKKFHSAASRGFSKKALVSERSKFIYPRFFNRCSSSVNIQAGNRTFTLETGKLAKQSSGSCVSKLGDTTVLAATVRDVYAKEPEIGMAPLTVFYRERAAAAGRIPANFLRRDVTSLTDQEILTSRAIDRAVRPLFNFGIKTELVVSVLSLDPSHHPDVLALNAASASLAVSEVPFSPVVGAVRVGVSPTGECTINPTQTERKESLAELLLACTEDQNVTMLEFTGKNLPLNHLEAALEVGSSAAAAVAREIATFAEASAATKMAGAVAQEAAVLEPPLSEMVADATTELRKIILQEISGKRERGKAVSDLKTAIIEKFSAENPLDPAVQRRFDSFYGQTLKDVTRDIILTQGRRPDGRLPHQIRPVCCEIDPLPALHGSGLFTKGESQVLATVTLDSKDAAFRHDPVALLMGSPREKKFMAQYLFNQFSTNTFSQGFSRRDLGHSRLVENSLKTIIPDDFPFTARLSCEVLESAGSTSMASVCAGYLALRMAGICKTGPIAGIATGIILAAADGKTSSSQDIQEDVHLMDITGFEDFSTEMDLKVATTATGVTCAQMDCKVGGIPLNSLLTAFRKAFEANQPVIECLAAESVKAKGPKKLPVEERLTMPAFKRAILLRNGAYLLKKIQEETSVRINTVDLNELEIFAYSKEALEAAKSQIETYLEFEQPAKELEFGGIYSAKILDVQDRGMVVSLPPNIDEAFIPLRLLDARRGIGTAKMLGFSAGGEIQVKYFGLDPDTGKPRLSRKLLQRLAI